MENKENALNNFLTMIYHSWTYDRMTEEEKENFKKLVFDDVRVQDALKGSYNQRWQFLQAIYSAYLKGLGYTDFNWRE